MQRSEFRLLKLLLCQSVQWCEKVFDSFGFEVSCLATRWVRTSMDVLKCVPHIEQWKWANICQWFLADFLRMKLFVAKYKEVECLCSFFVLKLFSSRSSVWLEFVFSLPVFPHELHISLFPSYLSPTCPNMMSVKWMYERKGVQFHCIFVTAHDKERAIYLSMMCKLNLLSFFLKLLFEKMNL